MEMTWLASLRTAAEVGVGGAADMFDDQGAFKKPETKAFFEKYLAAYEAWVNKTA